MEEWQILLLKAASPLLVILGAGRIGLPLGAGLLGAGLLVSWLFDQGFSKALATLGSSIVSGDALCITGTVALIALFNGLLGQGGRMERVSGAMAGVVRSMTARLAFFPMLIGLLPMPGGAVFSAPMVEAVARGRIAPLDSAIVNYWFRHCCEYCWPLYPGMVLLSALSGWPLSRLALAFFPVTLSALLLGCLYIFIVTLPSSGQAHEDSSIQTSGEEETFSAVPMLSGRSVWYSLGALFMELWPLILVIALFLASERLLKGSVAGKIPGLSLLLPMALTLVVMTAAIPGAVRSLRRTLGTGNFWSLIAGVAGIMYFKASMEACGVAAALSTALPQAGQARAAALLFAFVSGLVLGYCPGMVGTAFPLVVRVVPMTDGLPSLAWIISAFVIGFAGVLLSPAHLCIVLTRDYFQASTTALWLRTTILTVLVVLCALAYSFLFFS